MRLKRHKTDMAPAFNMEQQVSSQFNQALQDSAATRMVSEPLA